jgi:hypothetical protein
MPWQVGHVQPTHDGMGDFAGSGFTIFDPTQQPMPVVTFGYQSPPTEAAKARDLMVEALKNAKHVSVHRR